MSDMQRRLSLIAAAFAGLSATATAGGCSDDVTFPGDGEGGSGAGQVEKQTIPAPAGARRLLARQYINSVRVIFGDAAAAAAVPPIDLRQHGLSTIGANELAMPIGDVERYDTSGQAVGRAFAADPQGLAMRWPCDAGETTRGCFEEFVSEAGRLAWRRRLTTAEVQSITDIAVDAAAAYESLGDPFVEGVQYAVTALLTAPDFLYIVELGDPEAENPEKKPLTATELVTRMSFFLTDTTPDATLLDVAEAGELAGDEDVRALAQQLVERPEAREALTSFFDEVYQIDRVPTAGKTPDIYPAWNEEVAATLREATLSFIEDVVWSGDSRALMNARFAYVNDQTAPFYGLESSSPELQRVSLPPGEPRAGLVGQPGILAVFSAAARSSPTKRGVFIRRALQCISVPPPPADVVPELPEIDPDEPMTTKDLLLKVHMEEPSCAGCHELFDPVGLAFEQFDGVGVFRTKDENGLTIDPSGQQSGLGSFEDAGDVAELLAEDPDVPACLALNIFRNSMGHLETDGEEAAIAAIESAFAESEFRVQDLLVEIVASPAFKLVGEPK